MVMMAEELYRASNAWGIYLFTWSVGKVAPRLGCARIRDRQQREAEAGKQVNLSGNNLTWGVYYVRQRP